MGTPPRAPYPTDAGDDEWDFVAPSRAPMRPDGPPRVHKPRAVFNAPRWIVRAGAPWRPPPHEFPPWPAVSPQTRRWLGAGRVAAMAHGPTAIIPDGR